MTLRMVSLVGLWAVMVGCSGDLGGDGTSAAAGSPGAGGASAGSGGRGAGGTAGTANNCSFTPCGGNVVGTWTAQTACGNFAAASQAAFAQYPACAGLVQSATVATFSMTATFSTDGTYSTSGNATVNIAMVMTQACLTDMAGQATTLDATVCQTFATSLAGQSGVTGASCTFTGGNCACQYTGTSTLSEAGNYSVSGSTLTTTPAGGTASSGSFCVQGTTLQLQDATGIVSILQRQS
jgi:hypothetical protein